MFAPYLMGTLVVEFNNVFLHARRLYLFAGGEKRASSDFYMWNLYCLIGMRVCVSLASSLSRCGHVGCCARSSVRGVDMIVTTHLAGTYPLFRFVPHAYLIHRVWDDYAHFPETWMFWTAFTGMLVMNVLNVVLFRMILMGDKALLTARAAPAKKAE